MDLGFWGNFWNGLSRVARFGLAGGVLLIAVITTFIGYSLMRTEYRVLFSDLTPHNAASVVAELERQKVPHRLQEQADGVTTVLVDKNAVHQTRIQLMNSNLPINGTLGFELFNNSDFGMTEFAQKINYQRALQGELARTILSIEEIREARVLLALPEQGLFKQATSKPKASVTLTLKGGRSLRGEQVAGIQRLVAAAVPGIAIHDVTLVDQTGVALTRFAGEGDEGTAPGVGHLYLDLKRDIEKYLSRKACVVLDKALGAGTAVASVDAQLDMDRVQTSTEEILGAASKPDETLTGILVKEREVIREPETPLQPKTGIGSSGGSTQSEAEYAVGRRIEQVISQPGTIRGIQVAVVLKRALPADQLESLRSMVAASVGASAERGDSVIIHAAPENYSSAAGDQPKEKWVTSAPGWGGKRAGVPPADGLEGGQGSFPPWWPQGWSPFLWAGGLLVTLALVVLAFPRRGAEGAKGVLSEAERLAALSRVQEWMGERSALPTESQTPSSASGARGAQREGGNGSPSSLPQDQI